MRGSMCKLYSSNSRIYLASIRAPATLDSEPTNLFYVTAGYHRLRKAWNRHPIFVLEQKDSEQEIIISRFPTSRHNPGQLEPVE